MRRRGQLADQSYSIARFSNKLNSLIWYDFENSSVVLYLIDAANIQRRRVVSEIHEQICVKLAGRASGLSGLAIFGCPSSHPTGLLSPFRLARRVIWTAPWDI